jgi:histone H3/H4
MKNSKLPKAQLGKIVKVGTKLVKAGSKATTAGTKSAKKLAPIIDFKTAISAAKPAKLVTTAQRDIQAAELVKKLDQARAAAKPISKVAKAKEVVKKGSEKMASGVKSIADKVTTGLLLGVGSGTGTVVASNMIAKDKAKAKAKPKVKTKTK